MTTELDSSDDEGPTRRSWKPYRSYITPCDEEPNYGFIQPEYLICIRCPIEDLEQPVVKYYCYPIVKCEKDYLKLSNNSNNSHQHPHHSYSNHHPYSHTCFCASYPNGYQCQHGGNNGTYMYQTYDGKTFYCNV